MMTRMQQARRQSFVIVAILLLALLTAAGGFWWLCTRSNGIAFLTTRPGAEWIIYPKPPEVVAQHAVPICAVFRCSFTLSAPPANATLTFRTFKSAAVAINGQKPGNLELAGENWKSPSIVDVTGLLRTGTNEIIAYVTNSLGPPALWLRLQADRLSLGTDERWEVSLGRSAWQKARRATQPPEIPSWSSLHGGERMLDSVKRAWPLLLVFSAVSMVLILGANRCVQQRNRQTANPSAATPAKWIYGLLAGVLIARAALFINNAPQLPRLMGFDADAHEQYIQFIQEKHQLPIPDNGWEMHQPPLYYAGSALVLSACGLSVPDDNAAFALRAVNGVVGLIHCWLALLCFRLLFPGNLPAQAAGLLVAAFLPPHLYLSQYVTNEPLAGLFVTVAFYFLLRALQTEKESLFLHLGIGAALGAAMLTKFSSLLAIPVFLAALSLRLLARRNYTPRNWLGSVGVVVLSLLLVCGWHYARLWTQIGNVPLPNWETDPAHAWRQDPGFRTSAYYFSFGQALVSPLFSAFHSFADGIYSTLWGDGLASGTAQLTYRPPWNYDLMNAGYLLGGAISFLAIAGLAISLVQFIRQPKLEWFVLLGLAGMFVLGIIYLSLRGPWLAHVKAFYAFPALVPFSALVAVGWIGLRQKHRVWQTALWVLLLVWMMTVYTAFWIRSSNPETYRVRGIYLAGQQRYAEAMENFSRALQLAPDDAEAHCHLAEILSRQNKAVEAARHYREALRIRPDFPEALNNFAWMLATSKEPGARDGAQAVQLAERACALTQYQKTVCIDTLVAAYAEAGRFDDAIATAQKARILATEADETDLQKTRISLAVNLNNLAWALATSKEAGARDGTRAVQLAGRACTLTDFKQPIFIGTLAAAYAEAGKFDDAISMAQKACALASESGDQNLLKRNQELLALYRTHQPYRETTKP
jgi:Tfp pilus assembly protein PilF/4-amino-4-deoxy-L-arabinose transferase-like glycosyltransferase